MIPPSSSLSVFLATSHLLPKMLDAKSVFQVDGMVAVITGGGTGEYMAFSAQVPVALTIYQESAG